MLSTALCLAKRRYVLDFVDGVHAAEGEGACEAEIKPGHGVIAGKHRLSILRRGTVCFCRPFSVKSHSAM